MQTIPVSAEDARTMISSHGYRLIKLGRQHRLSSPNGYAYEHRIIAEQMLGRILREGEIVHHKDGNRLNNDPDNLEICTNIAHHKHLHRIRDKGRRLPGEANSMVLCACGCGIEIALYDGYGRPRKYHAHHSFRKGKGKKHMIEMIQCACGCGVELNRYDNTGRVRKFISGHNSTKRNNSGWYV